MRWLLTYADMITLLTAFFIMMYSMSVLNLAKFKQVAISVRSGFNGEEVGAGIFAKGGVVHMEQDYQTPDPRPSLDEMMRRLAAYLKRHGLEKEVKCRLEERGLVISVTSDGLLFARGSAALRPEAVGVLDDIGGIVGQLDNEVLVEGHTCDLPISTSTYPSNWELSTARAVTVLRYLVDRGHVRPQLIGAAGYADTRPCSPNDTEAHRRLNRRVNLVVLSGAMTIVHQAQTAPLARPPGSHSKH